MQHHNDIKETSGLNLTSITPFSTGNNTQLFTALLDNNHKVVIKKTPPSDKASLSTEAYMLNYLETNSSLPVPHVYYHNNHLLVMDYVENDNHLSQHAQSHAAELLATLHSIKGTKFGLEKSTLIGPLHQPNTQESDWITFFGNHRLGYMAKEALKEDKITSNLMHKIDTLITKLPEFIPSPAPNPCLIHGDMWTGNALTHNNTISGFIDPAIYYADPEIELAFSTLFGTFSEAFFKRYNELNPIKDGFFELRKDLYNLYPLLVHIRLFQGSYITHFEHKIQQFI